MEVTAASTNEYVRKLLAKYDIDGYIELFGGPHYTKQVTPKDFDHLIAPFKTTRDVKAIATDLYKVAGRDPVDLVPLVPDYLVPFLVFHHPKPREQLPASAADAKYNEPIKRAGAKKRGSVGNAQPAIKRPRLDKSKTADAMSSVFVDEIEYKAPENLHAALTEVFNSFWELEMESAILTPFFALIDRHNCGPIFGMPDYFDKVTDACTLATIKEKLESKKYSSVNSFEFDFALMFDNVFLYYPVHSPQYKKAAELRDLFAVASADIRSKLR